MKMWDIQMMDYYSLLKRNKPTSYEKIWGNLNSYYLEEEANLKRLLCVGFYLYDILEEAKLWKQ